MFKTTLAAGAFALLTVFSTTLPTYAAGVNPAAPVTAAPAAAAVPAVTPVTLTSAESASLQYMREEEKLAHDVYVTLYAKWGLRIFNNISGAEQRHTDAIVTLLNRYGISDPAAGNPLGVFTNPDLQALYDKLIAQGSISTAEALKVGVLIEQTDIEELKTHIAETTKADILQVYNNLLGGSQNHLRAFSR